MNALPEKEIKVVGGGGPSKSDRDLYRDSRSL